jgi:hypothetical protein
LHTLFAATRKTIVCHPKFETMVAGFDPNHIVSHIAYDAALDQFSGVDLIERWLVKPEATSDELLRAFQLVKMCVPGTDFGPRFITDDPLIERREVQDCRS